jgi:hypothetical protein
VDGNWDLPQFKMASGETDWDAVIDAEARTPLTSARNAPGRAVHCARRAAPQTRATLQ